MLIKNRLTKQWRNTSTAYGRISFYLHWFTAGLVVALITIGLLMDWTITFDDQSLYAWLKGLHISLGIILAIFIVPVTIWQIMQQRPQKPDQHPILSVLAYLTPRLLLLTVLAQSVIGVWSRWTARDWPMESAAGLNFFDLFTIPSPYGLHNPGLNKTLEELHIWLADFILILLCIHLVGAIYLLIKTRLRL